MAEVKAMWHFSCPAWRAVRIRPWRDNLERRRQDGVQAVLSGAAVELGGDAWVTTPPNT